MHTILWEFVDLKCNIKVKHNILEGMCNNMSRPESVKIKYVQQGKKKNREKRGVRYKYPNYTKILFRKFNVHLKFENRYS